MRFETTYACLFVMRKNAVYQCVISTLQKLLYRVHYPRYQVDDMKSLRERSVRFKGFATLS